MTTNAKTKKASAGKARKLEGIPEIVSLDIEVCERDPGNFRGRMDAGRLNDLKATILQHGIQENCVAYFCEESGRYRFIDGNRRLVASGMALKDLEAQRRGVKATDGTEVEIDDRIRALTNRIRALSMIPTRVLTDPDEIREAKVLQLMLNLQNEDVGPLAEARGFEVLVNDLKLTVAEIAARVGCSLPHVRNRLRLLMCPKDLVDAYESPGSGVKLKHCLKVALIPGEEEREKAAQMVLSPKYKDEVLTVSETEELIEREFKRDLTNAPFDVNDEALCPEAGSCAGCEFRSGNMGEVLDRATRASRNVKSDGRGKNVSRQGGRGLWICTKTGCYDGKVALAVARRKAIEEEEGYEIVDDRDAAQLFGGVNGGPTLNSRYARLEDKPLSRETGHHNPDKVESWRALMEKANEGLPEAIERKKRIVIEEGNRIGLTAEQALSLEGREEMGISEEAWEGFMPYWFDYQAALQALEMEIPVAVAFHKGTGERVEAVDREKAAEVLDAKYRATQKFSPFEHRHSPGDDRKEKQKASREAKKRVLNRGVELGEALARKIAEAGKEDIPRVLVALLGITLDEEPDAGEILRRFLPLGDVKISEEYRLETAIVDFVLDSERPLSHYLGYLTAAMLGPMLRWEADQNVHVRTMCEAFGIELEPLREGGEDE